MENQGALKCNWPLHAHGVGNMIHKTICNVKISALSTAARMPHVFMEAYQAGCIPYLGVIMKAYQLSWIPYLGAIVKVYQPSWIPYLRAIMKAYQPSWIP